MNHQPNHQPNHHSNNYNDLEIRENAKSIGGFFNYVFDFSPANKSQIMNMMQYSILSVIPVLCTLRAIKHFIPEDNDVKSTIEITVETVLQISFIMISIWFTHRIIQYIPTYSGVEYSKFNEVGFVIPFILILATLQTKLGAKLNILIDRAVSIIPGYNDTQINMGRTNNGGGGNQGGISSVGGGNGIMPSNVRISQPISGGIHQPSQSDYLDHSQILPSNPLLSLAAMPNNNPSYNNSNNNTPVQNNGPMQMEPMAANDGGWGSSPW